MLESQVGSIQSTLAELVCTLKAANTANGIGNGTGTGGGGGENGGPSSSSAASSARSRHHQPQQQQQQREEYASPTIYNGAADPLPNMAQYEGSLISIISPAASGGADHHLHQHAGSSTAAAESSLPSAYRSYPYGSNGGGGPSSSSTAAGVYSHPHHGGSTRTVPLSIPDNHPYPLPPPIPTSRHGPRSSSHAGVGGSSSSSSALPGGVLGGRQLPTNPSSASGSVYANLLSQALYPHRQKHHVGPATSSARTTPAGSEADEDELLHREELEFPTRSALEPLGAMGRLAQAALLEQDGPAASGAAGAGSLMGGQQAAGEGPGEPSSSTTAGGRSSLGGKKEPGSGTGKGGLDGLLLLAEGAKHSPKADESGSAGPSTAANSPSASGPLAESSTAGGAGTSAAAALEGESRRPGKRARFAENDDEANGRGGSRLSSSSGGRHTIGVDGGRRPLSAGTGLRESHILGGPGMAGGDGGPPIGKDGRILDCIDAGIVDLEEGRELFDMCVLALSVRLVQVGRRRRIVPWPSQTDLTLRAPVTGRAPFASYPSTSPVATTLKSACLVFAWRDLIPAPDNPVHLTRSATLGSADGRLSASVPCASSAPGSATAAGPSRRLRSGSGITSGASRKRRCSRRRPGSRPSRRRSSSPAGTSTAGSSAAMRFDWRSSSAATRPSLGSRGQAWAPVGRQSRLRRIARSSSWPAFGSVSCVLLLLNCRRCPGS